VRRAATITKRRRKRRLVASFHGRFPSGESLALSYALAFSIAAGKDTVPWLPLRLLRGRPLTADSVVHAQSAQRYLGPRGRGRGFNGAVAWP
jgi:hypothetical protein